MELKPDQNKIRKGETRLTLLDTISRVLYQGVF
jgi:hypothetical protein